MERIPGSTGGDTSQGFRAMEQDEHGEQAVRLKLRR